MMDASRGPLDIQNAADAAVESSYQGQGGNHQNSKPTTESVLHDMK
jgi:hypothetical protein